MKNSEPLTSVTPEKPDATKNTPKKFRHRKKQLYNSILKQMEFYLGDANLSKNRFLGTLMKNDPYIPLSVFMTFNKLRLLTDNVDDIAKALAKSELLKLSDDETKVCRATPLHIKENVDECTIYVECLPPNADHDWLKNIFTTFGEITYVSIPRFQHNNKIKGFAFIEFEEPDSAAKCLEAFAEMGLKLVTGMNSEQLCSITTFEDPNQTVDKAVAETSSKVKYDETVQSNDSVIKPNVKCVKEKKRKHSEIDENKEVETRKSQHGLNDMDQHSYKKTENDCTLPKKQKRENSKPDKEQNVAQPVVSETSELETEDNENEENEESDNKESKKKRKRKKHVKKYKEDIASIGLKVLSKKEWKKLRNNYLTLQKSQMQLLKKQLNINRDFSKQRSTHYQQNFYGGNDESTKISENIIKEEIKPTGMQFIPGIIVNLKLHEPCIDVKGFKSAIKSISPEIKYIDVNEGAFEAYIRFTEDTFASNFVSNLNVSPPTEVNEVFSQISRKTSAVLKGTSEQEYWDKMAKDRDDKRSKNIKIERKGKVKLIAKAAKNSHSHFNEEDD